MKLLCALLSLLMATVSGGYTLETSGITDLRPARAHMAAGKAAENTDTVGWLTLPGAGLDQPVLLRADDRNTYYAHRDFDGRYSREGSVFADYRCDFGGGGREGLPMNTVLYASSFDDDPQGAMFSRLKRYRDPDFARDNPYLYFATTGEDFVFEVFAVSEVEVLAEYPYNVPTLEQDDRLGCVAYVMKNSHYDYGVTIRPHDKLLTLSTSTYLRDPGYPNNDRFVIMARLVDGQAPLQQQADFTVQGRPYGPTGTEQAPVRAPGGSENSRGRKETGI